MYIRSLILPSTVPHFLPTVIHPSIDHSFIYSFTYPLTLVPSSRLTLRSNRCLTLICSSTRASSQDNMAFSWKPTWLEALNTQKFFVGCSKHEFAKKNEKNICCLDCCTSICPHCLPSHRYHRVVQVRRYVYHDVVRLEDLEKLIDCSNVQSYTINSSKVVFIKKRPQNRHFKGSGNFCTSCDRCLQEPYIHCSLGCKVDYVLTQNMDISPYLRTCDSSQFTPVFLVSQDTNDTNDTNHSTVMEGDESMGSSDTDNLSAVPCTGAFVKKKRSGLYICRTSSRRVSSNEEYNVTNMSKRKGIPHRSPLC